MKTLFRMAFALTWASALVCAPALAQDGAPDALIRGLTSDVLSAIRHDKEAQAGNTTLLEALVETRIAPHADFRRATQTAVGPAWRNATPEPTT